VGGGAAVSMATFPPCRKKIISSERHFTQFSELKEAERGRGSELETGGGVFTVELSASHWRDLSKLS